MSTGPRDEALEALDDYVSGAMDDDEATRFEAALFDAAVAEGAASDAAWLERFRRGAVELAARGSFDITYTLAEAQALMASSPLDILFVDAGAPPPASETLRLLADRDLAIFSFPVDLSGVAHVDLELGTPEQPRVVVLPDVKVDRDEHRVLLCCEGDLARVALRQPFVTTVVAVDGPNRRVLGQFHHAGATAG